VVDGTAATPVLQRPLHHGADLVVHSASKGLNGHGDVLAGAVVAKEDGPLWQQIRAWRHDTGAVLGAFEAWLLLRGLRTLELRVRRADATAMALAQRLSEHPGVRGVLYPGLPHHPGHELARRQMQGFGTTLSLLTGGGTGRAFAVAAGLHLWTRATSLGGYESLVEHRASIEGAGTLAPPDLLRLSVGLEDLEDLWADLRQALEEAPTGAAGREG
jgi:cystathionine gamma-synthase